MRGIKVKHFHWTSVSQTHGAEVTLHLCRPLSVPNGFEVIKAPHVLIGHVKRTRFDGGLQLHFLPESIDYIQTLDRAAQEGLVYFEVGRYLARFHIAKVEEEEEPEEQIAGGAGGAGGGGAGGTAIIIECEPLDFTNQRPSLVELAEKAADANGALEIALENARGAAERANNTVLSVLYAQAAEAGAGTALELLRIAEAWTRTHGLTTKLRKIIEEA